jgi:hypothetical protein
MTQRWDEFSKSLVDESVPRRESLRRLGFVLTGAVLSPLGLQSAFAGKTDPCKSFCKCRNKRQQDQCLKACKACNKNTSRLAGTCGGYSCCATSQTSCGSYCTSLASDVYNCGGCGHVCDQPGPFEYGACINGNCVYACAQGAARCDGVCTYLGWDPDNCGRCGNVCPASAPYCEQGVCTATPCPGGQTRCSGVCYDLYNDSNNCGVSCDTRVVCGQYETCTGGVCVPVDAPSPEFW